MQHDIASFIRAELLDVTSQWNLGTFGAIAEFTRDPGEAFVLTDQPGNLAVTTARGGIGFHDLSLIQPFASENAIGQSWSHRVALCLPENACAMSQRTVLTDLGADAEALREEDRDAILFDMGLGRLQVDICIRTADPELIALLRRNAGRSLFEPGNPAMGAILSKGPHRVFMARFGRCEVYQPIPPADGKSPEGPHTHVLPKLLAHGRTHAATEHVPDGLVPCAHLVPAHPIKDDMGHARPFDADALLRFDGMLERFGAPALVTLKKAVHAGVAAGDRPETIGLSAGRFERHAIKVALRQIASRPDRPAALPAWLETHDRVSNEAAATDDYGHA